MADSGLITNFAPGKLKVRNLELDDFGKGFRDLQVLNDRSSESTKKSNPIREEVGAPWEQLGFFRDIENEQEFEEEYNFLFPSQGKNLKAIVVEQNGRIVGFGMLFIVKSKLQLSYEEKQKRVLKNKPLSIKQAQIVQIMLHSDNFII